jgi:hypothetical protein
MPIRIVAILVLTVSAIVAGYYWYQARRVVAPAVAMQVTDTACRDARAACRAMHPALGDVTLVFPDGAYYLHPFVAELKQAGKHSETIQSVSLELTMSGMDMGRNVFHLQSGNKEGNSWHGKLLLPVCVTGRVDWQVKLLVTTDRQQYAARFPLQVKRYQQP